MLVRRSVDVTGRSLVLLLLLMQLYDSQISDPSLLRKSDVLRE